jgi:hypothetical protein
MPANNQRELSFKTKHCCAYDTVKNAISRRSFLGGIGAVATVGGLGMRAPSDADAAAAVQSAQGKALPAGKTIQVQPALSYHLEQPEEKTSWRSYGGICTPQDVQKEIGRIETELKKLEAFAEFHIEFLPLAEVRDEEQAKKVAATTADVILLFAASGGTNLINIVAASKAAFIMFVRHKSGPFYLWYEIAHWRFLRQNEDAFQVPNVDAEDIIVDDYQEILWRLRSLYGLKNAKGTTMLAIGGLNAYSAPAQAKGPDHAKEVWGYKIISISEEEFSRRLAETRADSDTVKNAERQTDEFLSMANVTLQTERKFVVSSFLALAVCEQLMKETGATNFGFAGCMGRSVIEMLDTPPCLVLSLANDAGFTAYCHTDLSHTFPGVLMRWIAGKPTFVCNTHFPHDGILTVAHCSAPRKMNGKDYEPAVIMTHFESNYGAACKVQYPKGQIVTVVIPNLNCTRWHAFRGRILESPSYPACRSQMEIAIDGDRRRLVSQMEGFHAQIVYGDYLREISYALKKLGKVQWQCYSEIV